jgi:oxygen-dependent protoporphyrinogen oxidase
VRIVIVGGGIAGLAAAYELQERGVELDLPIELTLIEKESYLGGKIITEIVDGFVIEGGPDTFVSTKPWGVALARKLDMEERLMGTDMERRRVFVVRDGKLVELPDGLAMMVPTKFWPMIKTSLISPIGKLRMGLDFFTPPTEDEHDESMGAFVSRRLGREAYERLIEPLMSGIYAGDGDQLSLQSTFPFLRDWEREHGSLTRGALALRRKRRAGLRANSKQSIFLTPKRGLGEIVDALQAALHTADFRLGVGIMRLEPVEGGYRLHTSTGEKMQADAVILATPSYASADLLRSVDTELASVLDEIEYVSTATVSLAFDKDGLGHELPGHGYVIPRREGREPLACTWTSTKFPHRAPDGGALLRVFIGRAGQGEEHIANEAELIAIAKRELAETMGVTAEPRFVRAYQWPDAMPQYNLGHPERLERIEKRLATWPGLALAGAAYRGIGIPDCIHSGEQAAAAVLSHFAIEHDPKHVDHQRVEVS